MTLMTRLIDPNPGEVKLPVHQFMAALAELARGEVTRAQVIAFFSLSASEETQLDEFIANQAGSGSKLINRQEIHDVLMLGEIGAYNVSQALTRLGIT